MNLTIESTELFAGPADAPRQILRVHDLGPGRDRHRGHGRGPGRTPGVPGTGTHEVPVTTDAEPGQVVDITVRAHDVQEQTTMTVAEPGWTVYLVSHFHYDPVWWNTQAGYASEWEDQPDARRSG